MLLLLIIALVLAPGVHSVLLRSHAPRPLTHPLERGTGRCTVTYVKQRLDHFDHTAHDSNHEAATFEQRVFICNTLPPYVKPTSVWFYCGNEATVELYVNHTGLMWENAAAHKALMVFAEHRYFGESDPLHGGPLSPLPKLLQYLSTEQSLADFAALLTLHLPALAAVAPPPLREPVPVAARPAVAVRRLARPDIPAFDEAPMYANVSVHTVPVVAFGGSYGGMQAAWLRNRYPSVVVGAVAGSAPVLAFVGLEPPVNAAFYDDIMTWAASTAGGGPPDDRCVSNVAAAWPTLSRLGASARGRALLSDAFSLCTPLSNPADAQALSLWAQAALPFLAMGAYPYPSDYMTNGVGSLPPYPLRVACEKITAADPADAGELMRALAVGVGIYYNATGARVSCFDIHQTGNANTTRDGALWDWLFCQSNPIVAAGSGMMPHAPFDPEALVTSCRSGWGIDTDVYGPVVSWGGRRIPAGNIFYSNGELDPWRGGGVPKNASDPARGITGRIIAQMGHHADLMFSNPRDTPDLLAARAEELAEIDRWCADWRATRTA
eukprot:TRINITY_DN349_c0_g2_i1.p1 TRINITY_DN349_c0_g2~~TRINITY_DN349_c0_g2_i1.p1  ORF type:complete len:564 (+),score=99.69 TRINITY_DN349_c0_g2_i1:40-1692(+)